MVVDGDFVEIKIIKAMYECACERYKKDNKGGKPFLIFFKEFEVLCGFDRFEDIKFYITKNRVVLRKVSCYECVASIGGKKIATGYFGLGEYNG